MKKLKDNDSIDIAVKNNISSNKKYKDLQGEFLLLNNILDDLNDENRKLEIIFREKESYNKKLRLKKENQISAPFQFIHILLSIGISGVLIYMWFEDDFFGFFILSFGWIIILSFVLYLMFALIFSGVYRILTKKIYLEINKESQKKIELERNKMESRKNYNKIEINNILKKISNVEDRIDEIIKTERNLIIKNQTATQKKSYSLERKEREIRKEKELKLYLRNSNHDKYSNTENKIISSYNSKFSQIESSTNLSKDEKINQIIKIYSAICATIAIQPIPFADLFILTPIQIYMAKKIADVRGYNVTEVKLKEILKEIGGIIGLGFIAQQLAIGAYKTFIPFLGGLTTIPMVFGLTYGMGKVIDYYISMKILGKTPKTDEIKRIFKVEKEKGKQEGKDNTEKIKNKNY